MKDLTFVENQIANRNFKDIVFEDCRFENCNFLNTNFSNCSFRNCMFGETVFENCKFSSCDFHEGAIIGSELNDCTMHWCSFDEVDLDEIDCVNSELMKLSFCRCKLPADLIKKIRGGVWIGLSELKQPVVPVLIRGQPGPDAGT